MSFEPRDYLRHILAEADYLLEKSSGRTIERFDADETLRRASVRSLEVIGEGAKKRPAPLTAEHPEVDWRSIARMRDRLIHGYFDVDYQIVWDVVQHKIPARRKHIRRMIDELT